MKLTAAAAATFRRPTLQTRSRRRKKLDFGSQQQIIIHLPSPDSGLLEVIQNTKMGVGFFNKKRGSLNSFSDQLDQTNWP